MVLNSRFDLWLGNPNKTAALLGGILLLVWGVSFIRRRRLGFWLSLILSLPLGCLLLLTQSRGGILSAALGLGIILFKRGLPSLGKRVGFMLFLIVLCGFGMFTGSGGRLFHGIAEEDRSISNRGVIWREVPRMLHDAPHGVGIGNSGSAFMQWYQPLGRTESYRTLVNSHLTWLVEFGCRTGARCM